MKCAIQIKLPCLASRINIVKKTKFHLL
uniref:Uncharacterized protein n=1 Tax=Anguilla anguilla TaxID=7936 RepID=A0A0E9PSN9_ANGAN